MDPQTPPDGSVPEETSTPDTTTPETVKAYVLSRQDSRGIQVNQFVSTPEVDLTIGAFLNHCRDLGWIVEQIV